MGNNVDEVNLDAYEALLQRATVDGSKLADRMLSKKNGYRPDPPQEAVMTKVELANFASLVFIHAWECAKADGA